MIVKDKEGILFATDAYCTVIAGKLVVGDKEVVTRLSYHAKKNETSKSLAKIVQKFADSDVYIAGKSLGGYQLLKVSPEGISSLEPKSKHGPFSKETVIQLHINPPSSIALYSKKGAKIIHKQSQDELHAQVYKITTASTKTPETLAKLLKSYAQLGDDFLDRLELKWKIKRLQTKASRSQSPSNTLDDLLSDFNAQPQQDFVVEMRSQENSAEAKYELLSSLERNFCIKGFAFNFTDYLGFRCETKELPRLIHMLNEKKSRNFSQPALMQNLIGTRQAIPYYIPELAFGTLPVIETSLEITNILALWNLENIGVPQAHKITRGHGVKIAIIDTGVDYNHQVLSAQFSSYKGWNCIGNNGDPMDDHYHGTHVAGTVAGLDVGVAPEAQLLAYKVLNSEGMGTEVQVAMGIEKAISDGVDVMNLSLGSAVQSPFIKATTDAAYQKGIIVVAAAGNSGRGINYPAGNPGVFATAAVTEYNDHADFSNISDVTDISAPGVRIPSCLPNNKYGLLTGTSMASPHVAGVAALTRAIYAANPDTFESMLAKGSLRLGQGEEEAAQKYGLGLVQANNMVG